MAGLDVDASVALLRSVDPGLAPGVCAQLVEATAGNPLGLIELPRARTAAQRSGSESIVAGSGVTSRLAAAFGDRIRRLPGEARLAVIAAAASDPVDADVLPVALELLGVAADALDAAERDGLLRVAEVIRFRHPLVRMAALGDCTAAERRAVESALGEVVTDLQRRTWHRARATAGTDDELAAELVRVAASAGARVAYSAQARLLVEAARLSAVPGLRGQYQYPVDGAYAAWGAGSLRQADDLLAAAEVSDPASVATTAGLFVRWRLLQWRGETQAMVEVIERAVAESHDATPELAVLVRRCAMAQRLQVADPDPAVVHADEALARAGNDPWLRFLGHEAAAMACLHAGRVEVAIAHCEFDWHWSMPGMGIQTTSALWA